MSRHDELLKRYKDSDYIEIQAECELRKYWNSKVDTMCVLDYDRVYVKRGYKYEWEMYEYRKTKKTELLLPVMKLDRFSEHPRFSNIKSFSPPKDVVDELKRKKEMGYVLTEEEERAIKNSKLGITGWLFIIASIYIILRYIYLIFC